jgi:hypothetical protein
MTDGRSILAETTTPNGPSSWLMVVVDYEREPARIVTALGYRHGRDPGGWTE